MLHDFTCLAQLSARQVLDLAIVHLDAVDAGKLLDETPGALVEHVGGLNSHCLKTLESIECIVVPKGEVAFPVFAKMISIFLRKFVLQNGNKK